MGSDSNSSRIPKLRFPGFTGEWEEKKLGDILDYEQPTPYLVASDLYQKQGTPVLTAGKTFILGYTDETVGVYDKVPVIIFDDFVTESKYVTFPFKAKSSAMKMLSLKNKTDNLYFTYVSMLLNQKPVGDHKRHWISETSQIQVLVPPTPAEQQKIASCLSEMDNLISAQVQKEESLKTLKKGLMQQLFPQPGETTPQLRFSGFTGEWEEKKLGEIATFYKGKGISKNEVSDKGKTPCVRYGELYTYYSETIKETKSFTDIPPNDLFLSRANDVIIPSSGETKEDISTASCVLIDNIALGGDINVIRSSNNGVFLAYYLNNAKKNDIAKIAQGISIIHLYNEQLKILQITIPTFPEQQKIADCLSSLDEEIAVQQQKVEALKEHKKGLMQQLFPEPIK